MTTPQIPPAVRSDLAPTGKLRAGINYGNVILASRDPVSGELRGVHVDLARELGRRAGVPVELIGYAAAGAMVEGLKAGALDIALLSAEPARAGEIVFSPTYVDSEMMPGSRVVVGRFMVVEQSVASPKGRDAGAKYVREFIEDVKASGVVARMLERNGVRGVSVAPRADQ